MNEPDPIFCPDCGAEMIERSQSGSFDQWGGYDPPEEWMECPARKENEEIPF